MNLLDDPVESNPASDSDAVSFHSSKISTRSENSSRSTWEKRYLNPHSYLELDKEKDTNKGELYRTKRKRCVICSRKTGWHCVACRVSLCNSLNSTRDCAEIHARRFE